MIYCIFSPSADQNKRVVTSSDDNIQWKFLFGSYIPRHRREFMIPKYSILTGVVTDKYTYSSKH